MADRFKVGDKVIRTGEPKIGMKTGEVVTVSEYSASSDGYFKVLECEGLWDERLFKLYETKCYICGSTVDDISTDTNHRFRILIDSPNNKEEGRVCLECFRYVVLT